MEIQCSNTWDTRGSPSISGRSCQPAPKCMGLSLIPAAGVVNKDIDDKQCTIVGHIDDLKRSHKDPAVSNVIAASFNAEYHSLNTIYTAELAISGLSSLLINNLLILIALKITQNAFMAHILTIFAQNCQISQYRLNIIY